MKADEKKKRTQKSETDKNELFNHGCDEKSLKHFQSY